jgi:hypothetical protein
MKRIRRRIGRQEEEKSALLPACSISPVLIRADPCPEAV